MARVRTRQQRPRYVSVTALTSILYCEREATLRQQHGRRISHPENQAAIVRGNREHERHHINVQQYQEHPAVDRRCFIASAVYGADAWQVDVLRVYRDTALMSTAAGRRLVQVYYWLSPALAKRLCGWPRIQAMARWVLDRMVRQIAGPAGHDRRG